MAEETIVVGVDGSQDGLRAVEYAVRTALARNARQPGHTRVHLVHAVDDAILAGTWGLVQDVASLEQAGRELLDEAMAHARQLGMDDNISDEIVVGNPTSCLARASEDADLVVVGRRRLRGLERMFVGSTSASLVSVSGCPVIVISAAANPDPTGGRGRIAVGIEAMSGHSESTLTAAFTEAAHRGSTLVITHASLPMPPGMYGGNQLTEEAEQEIKADSTNAVETIIAPLRQKFPDVKVELDVGTADPVEHLISLSGQVDLLVLGMRAPSRLGFALGGVTRAVLAHATSPLMVVR